MTTPAQPLTFYFTSTEQEPQLWGLAGSDWADQMRTIVESRHDPRFSMAADPASAGAIVMWEPYQQSQLTWAPKLRSHPVVLAHPEKTYVVTEEDLPLGFLPGLYCSLPRPLFDPAIHRTWIYKATMNPHVLSRDPENYARQPRHLAVFVGAPSHSSRQRLFATRESLLAQGIYVSETQNCKFNVNPDDPSLKNDQNSYIDVILDSKFALCPRGGGTGSYRLQEVMALGRAPVVIADDWVPVKGPDWDSFAVFVKEADVDNLPRILAKHEARWEQMGRAARATWEKFFRPEDYCIHALEQIADIARHRTPGKPPIGPARWDALIRQEQRRQKGPLLRRILRRLKRTLRF